tara:strand:+ start:6168 stop:6878 length:711 start_codon:yes stop_codon:yes gene_type:complete
MKAQKINIPDAAFQRELFTQGIDLNNDGYIQESEAQKVTVLYVTKQGINNLEGISHFTNLEEFGCYGNQITKLDLSELKKLQRLYAYDNKLVELNISGLLALKDIFLQNNPDLYLSLDFTKYPNLEELHINATRTPRLIIKNLVHLKMVNVSNSRLSDLQIDGAINLESLWLDNNELIEIDFKKLPKIEYIGLSNNPIKKVDIRHLKSLKNFSCLDCFDLKQINTSGCENLEPIVW